MKAEPLKMKLFERLKSTSSSSDGYLGRRFCHGGSSGRGHSLRRCRGLQWCAALGCSTDGSRGNLFPDMLEEVLLLAATGRLAVTVLGSLVTSLLSAARGLDTNGFLTLSSGLGATTVFLSVVLFDDVFEFGLSVVPDM